MVAGKSGEVGNPGTLGMTKERATVPRRVVAGPRRFSSPWVGHRPMATPVGMTKGRVAFTSTTVAAHSNPLQWPQSDERFLARRIVVQVWAEPAFDLFHGHSLAFGIVFRLIAVDLAQAEIAGFRVGEVEAAYA